VFPVFALQRGLVFAVLSKLQQSKCRIVARLHPLRKRNADISNDFNMKH